MSGRKDQIRWVDIPDTFTDDAKILSNNELIEKYKRGEATITRWRNRVGVPGTPVVTKARTRYAFPDPQTKNYAQDVGIFRIDGDAIIFSDWHIPYHDIELAEIAVRIAEKKRIKQALIPGDLIDAAMYSAYDPHDIEADMRDEFAAVAHMLTHLTKFIPTVFIGLGNHDLRILRQTKFHFGLDDIIGWINSDPGVHVTPMPYMYLSNDGDPYRVTHPGVYSRMPARTPGVLADLFHCNIMAGHNHLWGRTRSPSGFYDAIDLGGLFDKDKIAYRHVVGDRTNPIPQAGFWTLKNGIIDGYNKHTRFEAVLGTTK